MGVTYPQITGQIGGNTSGTTAFLSSGTVLLAGGDNITLSQNQNSVTIVGNAGGGGGAAISAGTNSQNTGTVIFSNSNGISFGLDVNGTLTASHNGLTSQSNQAFSAQGGSSAFQTLSFSNANGATFSNNAGQVQLSYTVPTVTNSSMTVSDNATSGTLARIAFTNLNGVTLSLSTGAGGSHTIVGSHNALTSQSNQAFSAQGGSSAFQTLIFTNSNGISFSNTNGSVWGSHNGLTSQSNQALSGSNGSFAFQTATFGALNGLSFYTSNGSMVGSYTVPTQTVESQSIGMSNLGNTSGTTGMASGGQVQFVLAGGNNITISQSLNGASGTVTIQGATVAGAPVNFSAGTTSNNLGSVVFSDANGVTWGLNGSTITASAGGGAAAKTFSSGFIGQPGNNLAGIFNNTITFFPWAPNQYLTATVANFYLSLSLTSSSNSSHAGNFSIFFGIYTRNGSTLSSVTTASQTFAYTNTSSNSFSSVTGMRIFGVPVNISVTPGDYWIGAHYSTTFVNTPWFNASHWVQTGGAAQSLVGPFGAAPNNSNQIAPGWGWISTTQTNLPATVAISGFTGASGRYASNPVILLANYTI